MFSSSGRQPLVFARPQRGNGYAGDLGNALGHLGADAPAVNDVAHAGAAHAHAVSYVGWGGAGHTNGGLDLFGVHGGVLGLVGRGWHVGLANCEHALQPPLWRDKREHLVRQRTQLCVIGVARFQNLAQPRLSAKALRYCQRHTGPHTGAIFVMLLSAQLFVWCKGLVQHEANTGRASHVVALVGSVPHHLAGVEHAALGWLVVAGLGKFGVEEVHGVSLVAKSEQHTGLAHAGAAGGNGAHGGVPGKGNQLFARQLGVVHDGLPARAHAVQAVRFALEQTVELGFHGVEGVEELPLPGIRLRASEPHGDEHKAIAAQLIHRLAFGLPVQVGGLRKIAESYRVGRALDYGIDDLQNVVMASLEFLGHFDRGGEDAAAVFIDQQGFRKQVGVQRVHGGLYKQE